MITLCMIVKDEENTLKNCLTSVMPFVDEIIVVDTGSTDSTKHIALEFTEKVYDYEWCNDFSAARNFCISKATNDWVLFLDADEFVTEFSLENISTVISDKNNDQIVGRIKEISMLEDIEGGKECTEKISRLFNRNYFQYEGTIHEQIVSKDCTTYNTMPVDITVYHSGYTIEVLNKTNKLKRNMEMLTKAIEDDPYDQYLYFQLGKTNYLMKDHFTSCSYFEKALTFELDSRLEYVEDLIETYGYALINSGKYSKAMSLEKYLDLYSNSSDFHFIMGLIYMNNAKFTQAVESFLMCTKLPSSKVEGITTYSSYYNIGVIYDVLGFKEKAMNYYVLCGKYEPAMKRFKEK